MKSPVFGVALTPAKDVIVFEKSTLGIDFLPPSIISFKPALLVAISSFSTTCAFGPTSKLP